MLLMCHCITLLGAKLPRKKYLADLGVFLVGPFDLFVVFFLHRYARELILGRCSQAVVDSDL